MRLDGNRFRYLWGLAPGIRFLNHGSFGACPRPVLRRQAAWRKRMERQPIAFFARDLEGLLDAARRDLAAFVGGRPAQLAFVPNTTAGVNTVLRSLPLRRGDELLTTDHEYNACRNALEYVARRHGARVVVAPLPFPVGEAQEISRAILDRVTPRTRLALIDHVTSPTALVLPLASLVRELEARGVDTLVDGAHGPGMLPLHLGRLGAAYYTGNCHKWLCAPKGAAFLHVRADRLGQVRPLAISHGANSPRRDRSRFLLEFDWTGTSDPSAYLSVPAARAFLGALLPGGWAALRRRNHRLVRDGSACIREALGCGRPAPVRMWGSMAALPLPVENAGLGPGEDPLERWLERRHRIIVPVIHWPAPRRRLLRISAQIYNTREDYLALAEALGDARHHGLL